MAMLSDRSAAPSKGRRFKLPRLMWPPIPKTWEELLSTKILRRYVADVDPASCEVDQGRIVRACRTHNAGAVARGGLDVVQPGSRNLNQAHMAAERAKWSKLIYAGAVRADREERAAGRRVFWFAMTVVFPDHLHDAADIDPQKFELIRKRQIDRFRHLTGGVFEAGWIDISLNLDVDQDPCWSLHVHSLVGVAAETADVGKQALRRVYMPKAKSDRVKKPLLLRRTYLALWPKRKLALAGWISYCFKSARTTTILRNGRYRSEDGKLRKTKGVVRAGQLASIVFALSRVSFAQRRVIAGCRLVGGRLVRGSGRMPSKDGCKTETDEVPGEPRGARFGKPRH